MDQWADAILSVQVNPQIFTPSHCVNPHQREMDQWADAIFAVQVNLREIHTRPLCESSRFTPGYCVNPQRCTPGHGVNPQRLTPGHCPRSRIALCSCAYP